MFRWIPAAIMLLAMGIGGAPWVPTVAVARASSVVWSDEFNAPAGTMPDPRKWRVERIACCGDELQEYIYSPRTSAHDGRGNMVLTARREPAPGGRAYVSGRLSNQFVDLDGHTPFYKTYGRWEARLLLPAGQGIFPAFWALGNYRASLPAGWPACGELDIVETVNWGTEAHSGIHTVNKAGAHFGMGMKPGPARGSWTGAWHVFAVDWRPGVITWLIDGRVTGVLTRAAVESAGGVWVFDGLKPQSPILNLAVGGQWAGAPSGWDTQRMLIDWVRIRK